MLRNFLYLGCCFSVAALFSDGTQTACGEDAGVAAHVPQVLSYQFLMLETNQEIRIQEKKTRSKEDILNFVTTAKENNLFSYFQSLSITSVEQTSATVQIGQQEAVVVGQSRSFPPGRGGQTSRSNVYQDQSTGSLLELRGEVQGENRVAVELSFQASRLQHAKPSSEAGDDASPQPPKTLTLQNESTILLTTGEPQIIFHSSETRDGETVYSMLILTVDVLK